MANFALLMLGAVGCAGNDAANSPPERQKRTEGADIEARYKLRDSDPHAMADAVAACEGQIRLAPEPGADESDRKHRHGRFGVERKKLLKQSVAWRLLVDLVLDAEARANREREAERGG